MRPGAALGSAWIALVLALGGCHSHDHDDYDTLLACYEEHHNDEQLPILEAIVVCCLEHPIQGVAPSCTDTQAACVTHVTAELGASVTTADVQAACTEYIEQK